MARPSKFTPERRAIIIDGLRVGLTRSAAAAHAKIHPTLLTQWCDRFSSFSRECAIAEHEFERNLTVAFLKSAKALAEEEGNPKWLLEALKRRFRADWGDSIDIRKLDDDTILRLLATRAGGVAPGTDLPAGDFFREDAEVLEPTEV